MRQRIDSFGTFSFWLISFFLFLSLPLWAPDQWIGVGINLMMWLSLAASWVLFSGLTGYISLGHAVFFGLGAYIVALTWGTLPLWVGLSLSGIAGAVFAVVVGFPSLRVRGPYFVMLTFGLAELMKFVIIDIETRLQSGGRLVLGGPTVDTIYWSLFGLASIALGVLAVVRFSRFGAGLRALREDEMAAETIGIPVTRYKIMAFALSAIIPALIGGMMQVRSGYFEPLIVFDPIVSLTIICIAVIGGGDRPIGPVLGTIFLVGLSEMLWTRFPLLYMVILGILLLIFVLAVPQGLSGLPMRRVVDQSRSAPLEPQSVITVERD
jgi:branched-chain amino acid transport system permease protein